MHSSDRFLVKLEMGENVNYVYVIVTSDLTGLNDTNHLSAQACILARSAFSASAALIGLFTII